MESFNIHAAKTHLSKLIDKVSRGKEIIISKAGKPVAKIVPYTEPTPEKKPREFGQLAGKIWFSPDYDQADAEIEKMFDEALKNGE